MSGRKRGATFFDAETRVVGLDLALISLAEEAREEIESDQQGQIERASRHTSIELRVEDIEKTQRALARPARFNHGSNPPALGTRPPQPWSETTISVERKPKVDIAIEPETTWRIDSGPIHPCFEAAPAEERTELRPHTLPAGPYCAVSAPDLAAYQITREIASGGMGIVYEAFHRTTRKRFAIKYMREVSANQAKLVQRFLAEGVAASRVDHPGVAEVYDYGHDNDGVPYMVMEHLEGENLGERLKREPIASREFVEIARQLASILSAAHAQGIVHRDIKPDNIFLVAGPVVNVKLLDFGVAKFLDDQNILSGATSEGQVLGTPTYMSPEQCSGDEVSTKSDIYSLGCVFYQMLAGRVPFSGNIYDVILGHRSQHPIPLTSLRSILPPAMVDLVDDMMEKDPIKRLASMFEVSEAIDSIDAGNYTSRRPKTPSFANRPVRTTRQTTRSHLTSDHHRTRARLFAIVLATFVLTSALAVTLAVL